MRSLTVKPLLDLLKPMPKDRPVRVQIRQGDQTFYSDNLVLIETVEDNEGGFFVELTGDASLPARRLSHHLRSEAEQKDWDHTCAMVDRFNRAHPTDAYVWETRTARKEHADEFGVRIYPGEVYFAKGQLDPERLAESSIRTLIRLMR